VGSSILVQVASRTGSSKEEVEAAHKRLGRHERLRWVGPIERAGWLREIADRGPQPRRDRADRPRHRGALPDLTTGLACPRLSAATLGNMAAAPTTDASCASKKETGGRTRLLLGAAAALAGILLSGWILQAITRQWDDRQKAHDLKVSLASQIALLTSQELAASRAALFRTRLILRPDQLQPNRPVPRPLDQWTTSVIRIDTALSAYAPAAVRQEWRDFTLVVAQTLDDEFARVGDVSFSIPESPSPQVPHSLGPRPLSETLKNVIRKRKALSRARRRYARTKNNFTALGAIVAFHELQVAEVKAEEELAHHILRAHLSGFSTTRHDLLRDLVP
jgi:hypothetical protein